jgi:murein DD-endopeptidase MepM/ murein hydrolase activator NlpD
LTTRKRKVDRFPENLPTLLPVEGFLTSDFKKESWFIPKTHTGIDIAAKKGSVVRAAGAGVIIFANWTFDLGNLIIVDHGDGVFSYYGHNQRILKGEKSYVKKGEAIALLGSSGRSSGPHLHFEIWKDGVPVDPKEFILAFQ